MGQLAREREKNQNIFEESKKQSRNASPNPTICFYHEKYGEEAKQCKGDWCEFNSCSAGEKNEQVTPTPFNDFMVKNSSSQLVREREKNQNILEESKKLVTPTPFNDFMVK